jgi:hypothetical protein
MFLFKNKQLRRLFGAVLVVAGGLLLWLAPNAHVGIVLFASGIVIELVGIGLERKDKR